jgi:predicted DNA-binding transcriptional regulator AlpA
MATPMSTADGRSDPLRDALRDIVGDALRSELRALREAGEWPDPTPATETTTTWRERLWTCHPETRLDVGELSEALGKPRSAIYKLTSSKTTARAKVTPIPHRKDLSGGLVFMAGEVRAWIRQTETPVVEGESWTAPDQRRQAFAINPDRRGAA